MHSIDLNADLGEHPGTERDEQIMPFITSCNIACGGHIGDRNSVRDTIQLAKQYGVSVGAHPSYPDKENFGRQKMDISPKRLKESLEKQVFLVAEICTEEQINLHHVKPHGALYNVAARDEEISKLILEVIKTTCPSAAWMGLASSISESVAKKANFPFIAEGFADRQYEPDGSLRSRTTAGAVLAEESILNQVEELVLHKRTATDMGWIEMQIQSICLHGDTDGAITLAKKIRKRLESKGVQIATI